MNVFETRNGDQINSRVSASLVCHSPVGRRCCPCAACVPSAHQDCCLQELNPGLREEGQECCPWGTCTPPAHYCQNVILQRWVRLLSLCDLFFSLLWQQLLFLGHLYTTQLAPEVSLSATEPRFLPCTRGTYLGIEPGFSDGGQECFSCAALSYLCTSVTAAWVSASACWNILHLTQKHFLFIRMTCHSLLGPWSRHLQCELYLKFCSSGQEIDLCGTCAVPMHQNNCC